MKKIIFISCFLILSGQLQAGIRISISNSDLGFTIQSSTYSEFEVGNSSCVVFGPLTVKNSGSEEFSTALKVVNHSPWELAESSGNETVFFSGIFTSSVTPEAGKFSKNDIFSTSEKKATSEIFAEDNAPASVKGYNVAAGEKRYMFFRMDSPTYTIYRNTRYSFDVNIKIYSNERSEETIGVNGGDIEIPAEIKLTVEPGAVKQDNNFVLSRLEPDSLPAGSGHAKSQQPVCAYSIEPSGILFRRPCGLTIYYSGKDYDESEKGNFGIFYWDGYDWRFCGNDESVSDESVSSKISHLTDFAVFPIDSLPDYHPLEKIITPGLVDGKNDAANFDGLAGRDVEVNIFNVNGRKIRSINILSEGNIWDGKDSNGVLVENGVYIYQFEYEGKNYSGTIAVAK